MGTTPLTADQMLAALAKWGITPRFYRPDWRTHNRNSGRAWGPINGFLVHNFASDISDASSLAYLYNGDNSRGMPGPLSQFAIDDAGTVWVIGWGRANHGGTGDAGFADAMAHDRLSLSSDYKPAGKGTVDMNARTYGVEMLYGKAPTQAQRDTVVRLAAALMDAHGYAATSVGAHRESTITRSDPVGFQMGPLRTQVAALLKAGPGKTASASKPPTPAPAAPEGFLMALSDKQQQELYDRVMGRVRARSMPDGSPSYVLDNKDGNYIVNILRSIASKVGASVDPEAVAEALAPAVRDAVLAAGQPQAVADAVVAKLGAALNTGQ